MNKEGREQERYQVKEENKSVGKDESEGRTRRLSRLQGETHLDLRISGYVWAWSSSVKDLSVYNLKHLP